jgi:hypothetical protein
MLPAAQVGDFTRSNLETHIGRLDNLPGASAALVEAARYLISQTKESTINLIGFSLGGVVARGATVRFPDHPNQPTLAGGPPVNLITINAPLGSMSLMRGPGPTVGAFFTGILPTFYSDFSSPSSWYLNGQPASNVTHVLGSGPTDDVVTPEGQEIPGGIQPNGRFETVGSHVNAIQLPSNANEAVDALDRLVKAASSAPISAAQPPAIPSTGLLAYVGIGRAGLADAVDQACDTINARYAASQYTSSECSGSSGMTTGTIGGGFRFSTTAIPIDATASLTWAGTAFVETSGTRTQGNLAFSQSSDVTIRVFTVTVGPVLPLGTRASITPMVTVDRYQLREVLLDSLRAGAPQVQVRGGETETTLSGTAFGFGVRGMYQLTPRAALFAEWSRASFSDVFPENATGGWPRDLPMTTLRAGLVYSHPWLR